jgi:hypothetical protein
MSFVCHVFTLFGVRVRCGYSWLFFAGIDTMRIPSCLDFLCCQEAPGEASVAVGRNGWCSEQMAASSYAALESEMERVC